MSILVSLFAVIALVVLSIAGASVLGWQYILGVVLPYAAMATFVIGVVYRVIRWARSPVPFRIPTTCGQQKSLSWIKSSRLDNPHTLAGVIGRMVLEVLFFRSLFRNTRAELRSGPRLVYGPDKWLWAGGLAFHWSFLIIFIRHFKYFVEPVPSWILGLQGLDGFFQVGLPVLLLTDLIILTALSFLLLRRVFDPKLRYMSLPADYFALFLLLAIALSGVYVRYFGKIDISNVKELATGLLSLHPVLPDGVGTAFYVHLFLVSALLAYFPFSKLMHMGGVFLSPTRNLANTNRRRRHVNPWDYPVAVHTYDEYEDEFRDRMKDAGMPVERE
ncbi:MAG: sulfate reduction electron transfer complex DsrMKJOP subunit DsrM [Candidatus Zixiibacteriota bacterium]